MKKLELNQMENVEGGAPNMEIACGTLNMVALAGLFTPWGFIGSIGTVVGAYLAGCYEAH